MPRGGVGNALDVGGGGNGEPDRERGTGSEVTVDGDPPLMPIDDPFHQAETEAGAVGGRRPGGIDPVEALEDVRDRMSRHADARVAHVEPGALSLAGDAHA